MASWVLDITRTEMGVVGISRVTVVNRQDLGVVKHA